MIEQLYITHRWDPNGYYHPGQSGPGSNGNEEVLYIRQWRDTTQYMDTDD